MFRCVPLIICCCLLFSHANAQQKLKAKVMEHKTTIPLAGIKVVNLKNKQSTVTDNNGQFTIPANINDLLVLSGFAYENDTILVISLKPMQIFLEPTKNLLNQVNIYTQPQISTGGLSDPAFHNQTTMYQRDGRGFYKGGVLFRVWSNKKGERNREKEARKQYTEEVRLDIDKVFSTPNLGKYLPLKREELEGFKVQYIPSVAIYTSKSFNLLLYLDSCYKEFLKLPPEKRLVESLNN